MPGEYKSHNLEIANLSDLPAIAIAHVDSKVSILLGVSDRPAADQLSRVCMCSNSVDETCCSTTLGGIGGVRIVRA